MRDTILVILAVCVVGSWAEDCSAKIDAFHQCVEDGRKSSQDGEKAKWDALKPKIDACYTNNGCTPPAERAEGSGKGGSSGGRGGHGGRGGKSDCKSALRDAIKKNFEDCVKKALPGFVLPQKEDRHDREGHEGGRGVNHKEERKAMESCKNKQAVRDCKHAIISSNKPTDAEKKARFQARCDARAKCLTTLGTSCQSQMEQFKKAACDCRQQQRGQRDQIRAGIAACQDQTPHPGSTRPPRDDKQKSCDQKDYCKLGYDAWVADHSQGHGKQGADANSPNTPAADLPDAPEADHESDDTASSESSSEFP